VTRPPITADAVREMLADRRIYPELPAVLADDTELALDSMGMIWLLHLVDERHGLVVRGTDAELAELTSIRRIVAYLSRYAAEHQEA